MENQQEQILANEESMEDAGAYIIKNGNQALWDGDDQPESATEVESEGSDNLNEPSINTDEVDLSIFDDLDRAPEAEAQTEATEDAPPPGFEKFSEDFKKYMGFDMKEAMTMVQELQSLRNEITVSKQEQAIREAWGVDTTTYQQRMNEVREYASNIQKKNPEMFKKLDNVEGVKLIWSKLESEKRKGTKPQVPSIQTNGNKTPAGAKSSFDFTYSQVQKMSRDEYAQNARRIERAFTEGRVDMKR